MSGNKKAIVNIDDNCIDSENENVLLGITIESKLRFKNRKLNALVRISYYIAFDKRKLIMKAFIT